MAENLIDSSAETASAEQPDGGPGTEAATPRRRTARRTAKLDLVLAAAVDRARDGVLEIAPAEQIGEHVGSKADGDRLVTHRFEAKLAGYAGWQWYATLARVPRGKDATVCEVGLLPSEHSLLAPEWVPWADRVRPEDVAAAAETESQDGVEAPAADSAEDAPAAAGGDEAAVEEAPAARGEGEAAVEEAPAAPGGDEAAAEEAPAAAGEDEAAVEEAPAAAGEGEAAAGVVNEDLTTAADSGATEESTEATS